MDEQYRTKNLDHPGIVAGICEQIGLIEQIDARVPDTGGSAAKPRRNAKRKLVVM